MRRTLFGVLALVTGLPLVAFGLLQTGWGQRQAIAVANGFLAESGLSLQVAGISGLVPFDMAIATLRLDDRAGTAVAAEEIRLSIVAGDLLAGQVTVSEFAAGRIALNHLPETPPSPDSPPAQPAWPELPVDIAVERLDVSRLEIGAAVTGEAMVLTVDGSFALDAEAGATRLTIERLDGRPARLELTARVDPAGNALTLDLVAEEPEGGVVPPLLGWDYDGPWRLVLAGDGPLSDWHGRLVATADDLVLADIAVNGALDLDLPRLAIAGTLMPPAALLPTVIAPEPITVDLTAGLTADAARLEGTLRARGLDLSLDVSASRAAPIVLDATVRAQAQDLEQVLAGLELPVAGDVDLRLEAHGPLDALEGSVALAAEHATAFDWQASDLVLDAAFAGSAMDLVGEVSLSLSMREPESPDIDLRAYGIDAASLHAVASVTAAGGPVTLSDIRLDAGPTQLAGTISLDPEGGPIGFDVALATDAAIALAAAGFEAASGRLAADLAGAYDPDAGLGWLELDARGDGLSLGVPVLDLLVGPSPAVAASGQLDSGYGFQVVTAHVALPGIDVEIEGEVPFAPTEATSAPVAFTVTIESLTSLAEVLGLPPEEVAGSLTLSGTIDDPLSGAPRATIDVAGDSVLVAGQSLGPLATSLVIAPAEDGRLGAAVDATFEGDYGPVRTAFQAFLDPDANRLALDSIAVDASGARLTGGLDIDLATAAITGTLNLAAGNLRSLAGLTGIDLGGSATARVTLSDRDGQMDAAVTLNARTLDLPDAARIEDLTASATISDLLGADPRFRATARATTVETSAANLDDATLEASGSLADIDLTLVATGESAYLEEPFPLVVDAGARISPAGDALTVQLGTLTVDFGEEQLLIARPMTIRSAGAALSVTGIDASLLGGRIVGDIAIAPASVDVAVEATDIALDRSAILTGGIGFSAALDSLSVNLSGSGAQPSGTVALAISGVRVQGGSDALSAIEDARLTATAQVRDGLVDLEARVGNIATRPVTLTLSNAMRLSLSPFAAQFDHGLPLDGRLLAQTDLADLNPIIAPAGDILLAGLADLDITIGGVGGAPVLAGDGRISGGALEVVEAGLVLRNLTAEIAGEGRRLTIRSLAATDLRGGSLSASGWADFGEGTVDIDANLIQLTAFDTDYATVAATGTVTLEGPLGGPAVSGDITVRPAEIRFAEISTAGYVEVDAIDINLQPGQAAPAPLELASPFALPLDVRISVPNALYVRGYGLDSEWGGNLEVRGTTSDPVVVGSLEVLRGTVDLAGRPIEIGRGIVTFTGASPPDPLIDIEAVASLEDLSVSLIVSGPASSADFELQSVPALPQDEILSRLLFGVGRGGLSGNQAFQAGRALALLSGGEGDLGLVNALRNITGITGLSIETATDAEGNPAAQLGGYVADDVFLSVSRGTATGSGQAEISFEVFEGIDIKSSVTEGGDNRVGISFEWDY